MSHIITLEEAKAFMQISTTATDALIQDYIDLTEAEIDAYTGRTFALATYTEIIDYTQSVRDESRYRGLLNRFDQPNLFVNNYPIRSLSIANVTSTDYTYNPANGVITPKYYLATPTVTYVAGYTTSTAPNDLKLVAKMGTTFLMKSNGAAVSGQGPVQSKSIKDFSVRYDLGYINGEKSYLVSNKAILAKYTSVNL